MGKARKKAWKQIPRTIDQTIADVHKSKEIANKKEEDIFFEDVTKREEEDTTPGLTFRQKAHLRHKQQRQSALDDDKSKIVPVLASKVQRRTKKQSKQTQKRAVLSKKSTVEDSTNIQAAYDIWDEDPDKKAVDAVYEKTEDRAIADHFLKQTKKVKTKLPKSVKHVPSVLPAVQVASEGASYNPSMESYLSYAQKIADEEMKMEKQEYHLTKRVQLKAGERYCSQAEIEKEEQSGFWFGGEHENDGDEEDVKQQNVIEVTETISETVQLKPKAKTMKQRKTEISQKITEIKKSKEKLTKKQEQEILNLKSLLKDVRKSEKAHESAVLQQRTKRTIHKLTTTKRLGRGRFEEYLEPVLTSDELTGSLRRLKPQGDLIEERVKSLQKRNIVPIGGDKERRLKKRMREKLVERRDVKEVVKGSRVF